MKLKAGVLPRFSSRTVSELVNSPPAPFRNLLFCLQSYDSVRIHCIFIITSPQMIFCADPRQNLVRLHPTNSKNNGYHNINSNNVNCVITSDRVIHNDATPSTASMNPQSSGSHTVNVRGLSRHTFGDLFPSLLPLVENLQHTYSSNTNCNNVNSTITGDTITLRGWGASTITSDSNIGNKNSGNVDSYYISGFLENEDVVSTTNFISPPRGINSMAPVDTTLFSSDSNNARTLTTKGSGNRLRRFGKLVNKAFKIVTTTIGGILAPSRSSKIQAEKNARRDVVIPPSYTEVIVNTEKAKAQPSSPTPAISNSELKAPKAAGNTSLVSDEILPSTTATDFDQVNADHTKKEDSSDSASDARTTDLTDAVRLLLGTNLALQIKRR